MNFERYKQYAPATLRIGLALVYLWFGVSQLLDPGNFIGYLPQFLFDSNYATAFIIANGVFEIVAGVMLATGLFTRIVALLLALHLAAITVELGYGEVAVRDFGLSVATIAVFLQGPDTFTIDSRRVKQ